MNPDDPEPLRDYGGLIRPDAYTYLARERQSGYERRPEYSRGGHVGPFGAVTPSLTQNFSAAAQSLASAYAAIGFTTKPALQAVIDAYNTLARHQPGISWSDDGEPGSSYAVISDTNNIKKENGVKLRESIKPNANMTRPKASRTICLNHGQKFHLNREDMSWGCPECDKGRVAFNKWYRDTYSLGYLKVHKFVGAKHSDLPQEIVITADESFKAVAIMIQRAEPGVDAPVFVTDLGDIAVDTAVKIEPDESGVRTITLPSLYGLGEQVLTDDEDDEGSTIYDA